MEPKCGPNYENYPPDSVLGQVDHFLIDCQSEHPRCECGEYLWSDLTTLPADLVHVPHAKG